MAKISSQKKFQWDLTALSTIYIAFLPNVQSGFLIWSRWSLSAGFGVTWLHWRWHRARVWFRWRRGGDFSGGIRRGVLRLHEPVFIFVYTYIHFRIYRKIIWSKKVRKNKKNIKNTEKHRKNKKKTRKSKFSYIRKKVKEKHCFLC